MGHREEPSGRLLVSLWLLLTVAAALCAAPSAAGAATVVSPPADDPSYIESFDANDRGDYLLAWDANGSFGPFGLLSSSTSAPISPSSERFAGETALHPMVAVGPDGTEVLLWHDRPDVQVASEFATYVALRRPGSTAWTTQQLTPPVDVDLESSTIAFGPQGQALAVWTQGFGEDARIVGSWRRSGGTFGTPYTVFDNDSLGDPSDLKLGFDASGRPTLAWTRGGYFCCVKPLSASGSQRNVPQAVQVAEGDPSGRFGAARLLRERCAAEAFDEAPSGAAAIGMTCNVRRGSRVRVSQRAADGEFGPAELVPGEGRDEFRPSVSVSDPAGVTLTWLHRRHRKKRKPRLSTRVVVARSQIAEQFARGAPVTKYRKFDAAPAVFNDPSGQAYLSELTSKGLIKLASVGPTGLGPRLLLARRAADEPALAIDERGRGVAFWLRIRSGKDRIEGVSFNAPP